MADCGQWDAIRDTSIQERERLNKIREGIAGEIRRIRQAIIANLKPGSFEPIDAALEARLQDRIKELKGHLK